MGDNSIRGEDKSLADLLQDFYTVPVYQREYVWETEQVEQLLVDIRSELADHPPADAPEYFIGSVVVCPSREAGVLELIDGQQRMTTLVLTLCAIRDHLGDRKQDIPGALGHQISSTSTDAAGVDRFRYRLDLQYEDSGEIFQQIAKGHGADWEAPDTRSIINMRNAYAEARSFFANEFGDDAVACRAFYGYLTNKVKLIRIHTPDVAKALKIFETINDRGVGLDSMDLLKNLLFMKAKHAIFEKLADEWKKLQDTIHAAREKPLRFLRYFIFSRYDVDALREDEIYGWFAKNEEKCGYAADPKAFVAELQQAANDYRNFLQGLDQSGNSNRYLENLKILGGKAARQHLILLLAGRHLKGKPFDLLSSEVENLFFVFVITREPTRDFERNFARWAGEIRRVKDEAGVRAFVQNRMDRAKSELAARFDDAFRRFEVSMVQKYRLRYVLAKLTQALDLEAYGETETTRRLARYMENAFEIEHILPKNPSAEAAEEFGACEDEGVADRLGNLCLVERSINASLGNRPYSAKRRVYPQSHLLLTKSLAERPRVGANTRIDIAAEGITPFPEWNEAAVQARQDMLRRVAHKVWAVAPRQGTE